MLEMKEEDRIVKLSDGTEVYVRDPSKEIRYAADAEKSRAWIRSLEDGCLTREKMIDLLVEKGVWSDTKDKENAELQQEMEDLRTAIENGGISLDEAKKHAVRVIEIKNKINALFSQRISHLNETVEAKARNVEFNYLVSQCAVYNDNRNKLYFGSYDEYLNHKDDLDTGLIQDACSRILFGLPDLSDTPEEHFLKAYGFVDEQGNFVNEDGHLVDVDGRLIDEEGNYIKYVKRGNKKVAVKVDIDGNELSKPKFQPFVDKDGNPVKPKNS